MPSHAGQRREWLYSLMNFGNSLTMRAFAAYALFFYADVRHLPAVWASAVMTLQGIIAAVSNPIVGHISDNTRSRWGRRTPYLRFVALPLAASFVLVWVAPFEATARPLAMALYFASVAVVWQVLYTLFTTNYYALLPELFTTYEERTGVSARMNLMHTLGLIGGMALPPLLYGALGWLVMGGLFALLAAAVWLLGARAVFEQAVDTEAPPLRLREALRATLVNRAFVSIVIAQTSRYFATGVLAAGMAFYTKYSLNVGESVTSLLFFLVFVTAMPALFLWRRITRNMSPRAPMMLACLACGGAALLLGVAQTVVQAAVVAVGVGVALGGLFLMGDVILCDVIDDDELRTGRRREGMYFGMSGFITALSASLTAIAFGLVTSGYGYDSSLVVQPPSVETGFRVLVSVVPCVSMLLATGAMLFYPLHGPRLAQLRRRMMAGLEGGNTIHRQPSPPGEGPG